MVDPEQTPHSLASDLDLLYLSMSHLWDARHKWVKLSQTKLLVCDRNWFGLNSYSVYKTVNSV